MKRAGYTRIHFTEDELKNHLIDVEEWIEAQDFFDSSEGLVKNVNPTLASNNCTTVHARMEFGSCHLKSG